MTCALPAQRVAERVCARGTDTPVHGKLCGARDCSWPPFGAAAAGKNRTRMCLAKIPGLSGPWGCFMHPSLMALTTQLSSCLPSSS